MCYQKKQKRFQALIIFRNDTWYLGTLKNEIEKYKNNFDLI